MNLRLAEEIDAQAFKVKQTEFRTRMDRLNA